MNKALSIVENFANTHMAIMKAYTGQTNELNLPRGFNPNHVVRIEKDNRVLLLVALTTEEFHLSKIASTELATSYIGILRESLKKGGIKEV